MDKVSPDSPVASDDKVEEKNKEKIRELALERATKLALETVDEMSQQPRKE